MTSNNLKTNEFPCRDHPSAPGGRARFPGASGAARMPALRQGAGRRDAVMVVAGFPPQVKVLAQLLTDEGRLRAFVTGFVHKPAAAFDRACALADRVFGSRLMARLQKRGIPGVDPALCHRLTLTELFCHAWLSLPLVRRWRIACNDFRNRAIERCATRLIDAGTALVFGRQDAALESFRRARRVGARTVYELPAAYHKVVKSIMEREDALFPGVSDLPGAAEDFAPARTEIVDEELQLADLVIVGSEFVQTSLATADFPLPKVAVLPYACEDSWLADVPQGQAPSSPKNLVLHVGRLGTRKGTHRLLRAWRRTGAYRSHRLRLVGSMHLSRRFLKDFAGCYEHVPWMARHELRAQYAAADFFVLPSAAEGFALVILEALACGLPVVASRNSGAQGFLEHGTHGLLHEFGDEEELCGQVDWMLSHPKERAEMSRHAREKAASWTWSDYRQRLREIVFGLDGQG